MFYFGSPAIEATILKQRLHDKIQNFETNSSFFKQNKYLHIVDTFKQGEVDENTIGLLMAGGKQNGKVSENS